MRALVLAALLLAPAALAQTGDSRLGPWSQIGADARRSHEIAVLDGPLDVIAAGRFFDEGETMITPFPRSTPFALPTESGVFTLAREGQTAATQTCTLIRITEFAPLRTERYGPEPCPRGRTILGGHAGARLMLMCLRGAGPEVRVQALDTRTLEERWSVALPGGETSPTGVGPAGVAGQYSDYDCQAAIEQDRIVLSFSNYARNVIAAVDLDGAVIWSTSISAATFNAGLAPGLHELDAAGAPGFRVVFLTSVEGGTFAQGWLGGAGVPALAWIDTEGVVVAGYSYDGDPLRDAGDDTTSSRSQSSLAVTPPAGQGEAAIAILGPHFVSARVTNNGPSTEPIPVTSSGDAPVWWRQTFAYPSLDGVTVVSMPGYADPWSWTPPRPTLLDLAVTQRGELLAVSKVSDDDGTNINFTAELSWLDLDRRVETRRLSLPVAFLAGAANALGSPSAQLVGLDGGQVLYVTTRGHFAVLGQAQDALRPAVEAPDRYPPVGAAAKVRVTPPGSAARTLLGWEDGTFENVTATEVSHVYADEGARVVRVTAVYPDGLTATSETVLYVGAIAPQELTAIQDAFSPEKQNFTFFLLGLAVTGGGVLFAAILRRRRQSNLARETRSLHELQDLAARDPVAGLAALESHRRHLEEAHVRRKLDDAHFGLLDARTIRAMRATRLKLIGPTHNLLSPHFRSLLDTALEDGRISPGEMETLSAALAQERLEAHEAARVRALLAGWAR